LSASIIVADFDRARQDMLAEFRQLVAADPEAAEIEALTTAEALLQLLKLDVGAGC